MRTVYHRFPTSFDLDFELRRSFADTLRCLEQLNNSHTTRKRGLNLIKCQVTLQIAQHKTTFAPLESVPDAGGKVTEMADLRMIVRETRLTPEAKVPVSENVFLLRLVDRGASTEVTVAKEGRKGEMDAMDVKSILMDACP